MSEQTNVKMPPIPEPLIGFDQILDRCTDLIQGRAMPQVNLFVGREGTGKSFFIRRLIAIAACESLTGCGHCPSCRNLANDHHRDVWIVDTQGKLIKQAAADDAIEHLASFPVAAGHTQRPRILAIMDVDRLTDQALNTLLKTVEEPPPYSLILMSTSRVRLVRPTLLSRAIRWRLPPPRIPELQSWLTDLGRSDDDPEWLSRWIKKQGRSPAKLLATLDQDDGRAQKVAAGCQQLLEAKNVASALEISEHIARELKATAAEITGEAEQALNRIYWQNTLGPVDNNDKPGSWRMRRHVLRQLRQTANHRQITLNAQLTAEAIGMSRG